MARHVNSPTPILLRCPWPSRRSLIDPRWDAYVRAHRAATVYHLGAWAAILRARTGSGPITSQSRRAGRLTGRAAPDAQEGDRVGRTRCGRSRCSPTAARSATRRRTSPRCWTRRGAWRTGMGSGVEHQHRRAAPGRDGIRATRRSCPAGSSRCRTTSTPCARAGARRRTTSTAACARPTVRDCGSASALRPRPAQPPSAVHARPCAGTAPCHARLRQLRLRVTAWGLGR